MARAAPSKVARTLAALAVAGILHGCAQPPPRSGPDPAQAPAPPAEATPPEPRPAPPEPKPAPSKPPATPAKPGATERGKVSLYGPGFEGKTTASGERFDPEALTMAHPSLPFGTRVRVTNLENQRSVEVVVNDRGPFVAGRIADLSVAAARRIGMIADGVVDGLLEILSPGIR
jgi:rare lipoprotein A